MRHLSLIAVLTLASLPASAASARAPAAAIPPLPLPDECPCSRPGFIAVTERARIAQEFWEARSKRRSTSLVSSIVVIGSLLGGSVSNPTLDEASQAQAKADAAYERMRERAVAAGAIRVERSGNDERVYVLLREGADYSITPPR